MQGRKRQDPAPAERTGSRARNTGEAVISKRERIMDVAELLFAHGGFDGVSMRDIAAQAEVGLPLIVYHFGTKLKLYAELFQRRKVLLEERLAALRKPVAPGQDPLVHIVRAFVLPVMQAQRTAAGVAYAKLIVREAADPREYSRGIQKELFDPLAVEFIRAIRQALPDVSTSYAHWAYLFAVGALVLSVFDERIERLSDGKVKAGDLPRKSEYLVTFIVAGLRAGQGQK